MTNVRIAQLTQLVYDNQLVRKRTDTIYVCTDSHNIYFGFDLIFQEDDYKVMLIDYDEFTIKLTAYGPSGSETISITEYLTTYLAVQAIKELVGLAYKLIGDINSSNITQDLLIADNLGNVYNVTETEPFDVTNANKFLFVDSVQLGRYPQNSKILVTNAGTEENPIYKLNITTTSSGGGSSINVKPDWNALPDSDAEILNKPNIPSKTSELTNDSGYLTQEADPTVPSWAKQNSKPNYNLDEISDGNTRKIPTKISDLNNDSGFTANIGTITSVKMNGSTVSSNGEADLGIVITSHQNISGKADKVSNATSGDLAGLDNNGNLTNSGVSSSNVVLKSNTSGLIKNDGTVDTTEYGSLSSILIPNFDDMTPVRTIELDVTSSSWYNLFTRSNSDISSTMSEISDLVLFRIICTGTNIYSRTDFLIKYRSGIIFPFVIGTNDTYSTGAGASGLYGIRVQYPKEINNGYDWLCDFRTYNATARHLKIEIYSDTENITWSNSLITSTYNSTYQSDGSLTLYDKRGLFVNGSIYGNAITASTSSYTSNMHVKYFNSSIIKAGESIVGSNLLYMNNGYAYKISNKNNTIDADYGICIAGTSYSTNGALSYNYYRVQGACTFTVDSDLTYDSFSVGDNVYLRCKLVGDRIFSDGHLSKKMAAGYTWYLLGCAYSLTQISVNTMGSLFITLDENGMISHINGRSTQSTLMNKNYEKLFYCKSDSNINSSARIKSINGNSLVFNQIINNVIDSTDGWTKNVNATVISASDGIISAYNSAGTAAFGVNTTGTNCVLVKNHIYFFSICAKASKTISAYAPTYSSSYVILLQMNANPQQVDTEWKRFVGLFLGKANGNPQFGIRNYTSAVGEATIYVKNAMMIDLTIMFGPGNEPQDTKLLMEMFPLDYYNYNLNGSLITGIQTGFKSEDSNNNTLTNLPIPITTLTGIANGGSTSEVIFPNGLNGIGNVKDEINFITGKAIKRIGIRSYENGDSSSSNLITDETTTAYVLQTPVEYDLNPIQNTNYIVEKGGTEQWLPSNTSVPTVAPISCISSYGENIIDELELKENTTNKVTSISSLSTDTQYPSAKCVYDLIGDIETLLAGI